MFQDTCFTYLFHIQNDIRSTFAAKEPTLLEHADRMRIIFRADNTLCSSKYMPTKIELY